MMLADEFYFLAHDDSTGRPRLHARAVGTGLAAALLAELVLINRINVRDNQLHVIDPSPPQDTLARATLDQIVAEPRPHPVRTWLLYLGQTAPERVAERLWRSGLLARTTSRRLLRKTVVYVPVDVNRAGRTHARLATRARFGEPMDQLDVFLVGLTIATGLDQQLLDGVGPQGHQRVRRLVAELPPPIRELINQTQAAVGDAVLSHRV